MLSQDVGRVVGQAKSVAAPSHYIGFGRRAHLPGQLGAVEPESPTAKRRALIERSREMNHTGSWDDYPWLKL